MKRRVFGVIWTPILVEKGREEKVWIRGVGVARNYIFSLIWRCYGPKWDILDY